MIAAVSKVMVAVVTKVFYAFFTEKMISRLVVELLKQLSSRTTNTIDDAMVKEIETNLNR